MSTKDRILDAAEKLFGEQGFAATSLRQVIEEAQVNVAAIHYHYGSKDELLEHAMQRKIGPVNEARLALLDQFEAEILPFPPVEKVLEALLLPPIKALPKSPGFIKMMGRLHADGMFPELFRRHFHPVVSRFLAALGRAAPHLSGEELEWRVQSMIGVMASAFLRKEPTLNQRDASLLLSRLITFLAAGFHAPPPDETTYFV